jgi:hypothetical protein
MPAPRNGSKIKQSSEFGGSDAADNSLPELYISIDRPIAQALNEIRRHGRAS